MQTAPHRAILIEAGDRLSRGDLAGAEQAARQVLDASAQQDGNALHVMGLVRLGQGRADEAVPFLEQASRAMPHQPGLLLHLGQALALSRQPARAVVALSEAVALKPDLAEAWYERANQKMLLGQPDAEQDFRRALALTPGHGPAKLGLGRALTALRRFAEAEDILTQARNEPHKADLREAILDHLYIAQTRQYRQEAALASIQELQALNPSRLDRDAQKADLLLDLKRFDEALAVIKTLIARDPGNAVLHRQYNDVLYQLGREKNLLASYDEVPVSTALQMSKGFFILTQRRGEDAEKVFADVLTREPENLDALVSVAASLEVQNRYDDALAIAEKALHRYPDDPRLHASIAGTALRLRDPEKAAVMLQKILAVAPYEPITLARLGTAWRLLDDRREEKLMDYGQTIKIFDLEPPAGFSDMASFNAELEQYLATLHPQTREFLGQSLRGGTQTRRHLFGTGHQMVERIKTRIDEAVQRYIHELRSDPKHPHYARRGAGFAYSGAWSSRLADCGFHANHIHHQGWISSCYYAGLPEAVKDQETKQGWIKFGEPDMDVGLSYRHVIQPIPGRLVLFPSYMWHGTIPFRDAAPRTTIAFDVVPT